MKKLFLMFALVFTFSSSLISCRDTTNDPVEETVDDAGDAVDDAADEIDEEI